MNIVGEIPVKQPTMKLVPKDRPIVETLRTKNPPRRIRTIEYPEKQLYVPREVHTSFYRLCEINSLDRHNLPDSDLESRIQSATQRKDIFLRYAGDKPLAALSSKFSELDINTISQTLERVTSTGPIIRYFDQQERVQLLFPIGTGFHELYLFMDSGNFGVYGGSGSSAANYGLAWNNGEFAAMTMFLYETLAKSKGRIIHLKGKTMVQRIKSIIDTAGKIDTCTQEAKSKYFTMDEVIEYASAYKPELTDKITTPLIRSLKEQISAYDLSCRLTRLITPLTKDHVRLRVEYMAGEVIICYDEIKKDLSRRATETQSRYAERMKAWGLTPN